MHFISYGDQWVTDSGSHIITLERRGYVRRVMNATGYGADGIYRTLDAAIAGAVSNGTNTEGK